MAIDVTVLGDINVDMITYKFDKLPEKNKQCVVPYIDINTGGSACNTAIACARLGLKTRLMGKIGNDVFSPLILNTLKNVGVDRKIKISNNEMTGITFALSIQNYRSFITFKGTNDTLSTKDFSIEQIVGKVFVLSGFNLLNSLRGSVRNLFEYAQDKDMKTALDPNWDPDGWTPDRLKDLLEVLKMTDWFFPDLEEGKSIAFTENPNLIAVKLLMFGPKNVCLKLGEDGCLLANKNKSQLIRSFPVNPINTTGAGDVFLAALIKKSLMGESNEEAALFANAAAAMSITKFGLERYPTYKEVKNFIDKGEI